MKRVLCFGDSNTYGLIPGTKNDRYDENIRYTKILGKKIGEKYVVFEEGLIGRTTIYDDIRGGRIGINVIDDVINEYNPNYIIIMLGTNDIKKCNAKTENDVKNSMSMLLNKIKLYNTKIILVSPIHLSSNIEILDKDYDDNSYNLSLKLKKIYFELSQKYNALFLDASIYSNPGIDGQHLTKQGHINLGNALAEVILNN